MDIDEIYVCVRKRDRDVMRGEEREKRRREERRCCWMGVKLGLGLGFYIVDGRYRSKPYAVWMV